MAVIGKKDESGGCILDFMFLEQDYGTAIETMANIDVTETSPSVLDDLGETIFGQVKK